MQPRVYISYGLCEGPRIAAKFIAALRRSGYVLTDAPSMADIIITHSGGCFTIDQPSPKQKLIMVGIPYWPGKGIARRLVVKLIAEPKNLTWLYKGFWYVMYFFRDLPNWLRMHYRFDVRFLPVAPGAFVVINQIEPFMNPKAVELLANQKNWKVVHLPGDHDDIWVNPDQYVELLSK